MKKILLVLFFGLFLSNTLHAQKVKFGANAGMTYSKVIGMDIPLVDTKYGIGYMVGASLEYYLNKKLSLKANLSYDKKTSVQKTQVILFEPESPGEVLEQTIKTHYNFITLPILVKYDFKEKNGFFVNGGPFVGYLFKVKSVAKTDSFPTERHDYTDSYKKLDYGLSLGVGKAFSLNNKSDLLIEIRDNLGLAKLNDFESNVGSVKINSFNLIVGWSFDM